MARLVEAVLQSKDHMTPAMMDFLDNLLDEENELTELVEAPGTVIDILKKTKVNLQYVCTTVLTNQMFCQDAELLPEDLNGHFTKEV